MSHADLAAFALGDAWKEGERLKRFWTDMARAVPMRPRLSILRHVKVLLCPNRARRESWSEQETIALRRAVEHHGTAWVTIGTVVGRPSKECWQVWVRLNRPDVVEKVVC